MKLKISSIKNVLRKLIPDGIVDFLAPLLGFLAFVGVMWCVYWLFISNLGLWIAIGFAIIVTTILV